MYEFFIDHRELARGVTQSLFSNGAEILVNRTGKDWQKGDLGIPANGYRVIRSSGEE